MDSQGAQESEIKPSLELLSVQRNVKLGLFWINTVELPLGSLAVESIDGLGVADGSEGVGDELSFSDLYLAVVRESALRVAVLQKSGHVVDAEASPDDQLGSQVGWGLHDVGSIGLVEGWIFIVPDHDIIRGEFITLDCGVDVHAVPHDALLGVLVLDLGLNEGIGGHRSLVNEGCLGGAVTEGGAADESFRSGAELGLGPTSRVDETDALDGDVGASISCNESGLSVEDEGVEEPVGLVVARVALIIDGELKVENVRLGVLGNLALDGGGAHEGSFDVDVLIGAVAKAALEL